MKKLCLGLLSLLLAQSIGCASIKYYERGMPKRLDTEKTVSGKTVRLEVSRLQSGGLEVWVGAKSQVEMSRTMVYQTSAILYEWNAAGELLEIPTGIPWMVGALVLWPFMDDPPNDANRQTEGFWTSWVFAPINPGQSLYFADVVRYPHSEKELFVDEPVVTQYSMSVPERDAEVSITLLDARGTKIDRSTARTDAFGRVILEPPPADAVWLLAEAAGQRLRYRLR